MRHTIKNPIRQLVALFVFVSLTALTGMAQVQYSSVPGVNIKVEGTSNIHDWEMNANNGSCAGVFTLAANGSLTAVSNLSFSMVAEGLKSEHKAMDKNTYKAMNTDKYPNITYTSNSLVVKPGSGGYIITAKGKLSISSVAKDVELAAFCTVAADKSITCSGSYKMKMTDYNVTPPSIMFGAIKTGNEVTIKYSFVLRAK